MSDIMEALLSKVRQAINAKSVSVKELADTCGVSREYIYKILREDSHPTVPVAEKLASAVGLQFTLKKASRHKISA